jgi:hypothetical protein
MCRFDISLCACFDLFCLIQLSSNVLPTNLFIFVASIYIPLYLCGLSKDENGTDSALEVVALRRPPKPTPLELDVDCGQVLRPGDVLEALCTMEESSTLSSGAPAGSKRLLTKIVSVLCVLSPDAFHGGQGPQSAAEERLVTHGFTVKCDSSMPVSSLLSAVLRRSGCPNRLQVSKLERLPNLDNEEVRCFQP